MNLQTSNFQVENFSNQDLHDYNNHIIMYQKTNLNEELKDIIRYHNFIPAKHQMRYKNFKCDKNPLYQKKDTHLSID